MFWLYVLCMPLCISSGQRWVEHFGLWYFFPPDSLRLHFFEAQKYCMNVSSHMITIVDDNQNMFLASMIKSPSWIGYYQRSDHYCGNRTPKWTDDKDCSITFKNTSILDSGVGEPRGIALALNGSWVEHKLSEKNLLSFVCQWQCKEIVVGNERIRIQVNGMYTPVGYFNERLYFVNENNIYISYYKAGIAKIWIMAEQLTGVNYYYLSLHPIFDYAPDMWNIPNNWRLDATFDLYCKTCRSIDIEHEDESYNGTYLALLSYQGNETCGGLRSKIYKTNWDKHSLYLYAASVKGLDQWFIGTEDCLEGHVLYNTDYAPLPCMLRGQWLESDKPSTSTETSSLANHPPTTTTPVLCEANSCANGGTCIQHSGYFDCNCVENYFGTDCSIRNPCTLQSCFNGATCDVSVQTGTFQCNCASGYEGSDCYQNIDDCAGEPCENGGTCVDKVNGYECICRQGFNGQNCSHDIDECASDPCHNNATCSHSTGSYYCLCLRGYNGINCEIDINECVVDACNYRGTCTDLIGTFKCDCDTGFLGHTCEIDLDECLESPCKNGGTCKDKPGRAKCYCTERWGGETCELKLEVEPKVYTVGPRFGPVAGGTLMTVTGKYLDELNAVTVIIGGMVECTTISLNSTHVITKTPEVDENNSTIVNVNLTIIVELAGGIPVNTGDKFLYKGNPKINSIVPLETIKSGGTTLTVSGETFDAIASPLLKIKMVLSWYVSRDREELASNVTLYTSPCNVNSTGQMLCKTPRLDIPEVFYNRRKRSTLILSRNKRQSDVGLEAEGIFLDFYLGFKLDGVQTYQNLTESLPEYAKISVYTEPEFTVMADQARPISFRPNTNQSISIKGNEVDVGCTVGDYRIGIGLGNCTDISLTSNTLFCYPPDAFPGQWENDIKKEDGVATITIYLGTEVEFFGGYIKYDIPEDCPSLLVILTPIVVCFVVIIIVQLIVNVVLLRKRK